MRPPSLIQFVVIRPSLTNQMHGIQHRWSARVVHYQTLGTFSTSRIPSLIRSHQMFREVLRRVLRDQPSPKYCLGRKRDGDGSKVRPSPSHSDRPSHPRSPLIEQSMQRWRSVGINCLLQGTMTRRLSRGMKMATLEGRGTLP